MKKAPNSIFYRQRAEEAEQAAADSRLENVRQLKLNAAKAWRTMEATATATEEAEAIRRLKLAED